MSDFASVVHILPAYTLLDDVRQLFDAYTAWLGRDLSYQNYAQERADLPGMYAPPDGRLYIARVGARTAGCVALRRFDAKRCEMKRLYVCNAFRGLHIGQILVQRIVSDACDQGYKAILLDTLDHMIEAIALYKKLGFQETTPYYASPLKETIYFLKPL